MNVEFSRGEQVSKECILSIFIKRWSEVIPSFVIRRFCGSLFNPGIAAASQITKKPCHFGVVSQEEIEIGLVLKLQA